MEPETIINQALGDRYEIQSVIGKGGMAVVYKANQKNLNRPVALKVIHQNLVHDEDFIRRFLREAQICASLIHPNIVTVYDIGSVGTVHYMSMEYLEGITLRDLIKRKDFLSAEETADYIISIAETLNFVHSRGLIHRDVKTSNIFITDAGQIVLMDFGIVFSENHCPESSDSTVFGTPEYMSPEQIEGKIIIDKRSDIYSLGVVIFECLTGRLPFAGDNYQTTLNMVLNDPFPSLTSINPRVPGWLVSIVSCCLSKDRMMRFADGISLANALRTKEIVKLPVQGNDQTTRKISAEEINLLLKAPSEESVKIKQKKLVLPVAISTITAIIIIVLTIRTLISNSSSTAGIMSDTTIVESLHGNITTNPVALNNNLNDPQNRLPVSTDPESESAMKFQKYIEAGDHSLRIGDFRGATDSYNKALNLSISSELVVQKIDSVRILWVKSELKKGDELLLGNDFEAALQIYGAAKNIGPMRHIVEARVEHARSEQNGFENARAAQLSKNMEDSRLLQLGIELVEVKSQFATYRIGKTEVTQRTWNTLMGSNPSFTKGDDLPVERVSWSDVQKFFEKLKVETGINFRLPSKDEWEFAASGGQTNLTYSGSKRLSEVGWYEANSAGKTHPVKQLRPNNFDLYDMSGNVWEWCSDHSLKGGSWISVSAQCKISNSGNSNDQGDYTIGFRICRSSE